MRRMFLYNRLAPGFLERVKRHIIFRIAAVYAIASWILIQLSSSVFPNLGLPKDSIRFVIILVALGFPVMLVLAWTFVKPSSIEPEGYTRWKRVRLRIGSILSVLIIVLVCISGWYLWRAAVIAHVAQEISETVTDNAAPVFNPPLRSIAVLPFKNQSDDPNQQYFSDGITEEITSALGALPGVRVTSWQSTSVYRDTGISIIKVGKALNVANVLLGSISRDGNRIRISAQLVNSVTGYQLWSGDYDRTFKDVFAVQDDISKAIVSALQLHLPSTGTLVTDATADPNAHDFYLKGLAAQNAENAASLDVAVQDFQQAIRLDPKYAEAYAALGQTYAFSHSVTDIPLTKSLPLAKRAAKQALRLDQNLAAAHEALGMVYALEQKPKRAITELRRALRLDQNNARTHIIYATLLPPNKHVKALDQYEQAVNLDPNDPYAHYNFGVIYEDYGDYKNAILEYQATLGLAPQLSYVRLDLAGAYHRNSDDKSAVDILTGVKTDDPLQAQILDAARLTYMAQQTPDINNQALDALKQIDVTRINVTDKEKLSALYTVIGKKGLAIKLLEEACANGPETCTDLAINPGYALLRSEPLFHKLVEQYTLLN
ncbi:MAG: tetratricopeptide repeat protein [Gammaproteobacteria bacterium]